MKVVTDPWFKRIFSEFYRLYYSDIKDKKIILNFNDSLVSDYILYRVTEFGHYIIYLYNGTSIYIPPKWIYLFSALNCHSGDEILYHSVNYEDDKFNNFGYLMTKFVCYLEPNLSSINGDELLDVLGNISVIGTKDFRDWVFNDFSLDLDPLEYRSLNKNIDI